MLNLLIFESITANLKNIKKTPKLLSQKDFMSMKMQGKAMVDALYSDLKNIKQLNITIGKQRFGENALDFFSDIIPKIDLVWVIAPESDGELERFHIASQKKLWIGSGLQAIRLASNKLETKKYLKCLGINTPDEITFKSLRKKNYTKAVYKPIDGAGTTDTYIIENEKNILRAVATDGHRLAQIDVENPGLKNSFSGIIVPKKTVAELRMILENENDDISISISFADLFFINLSRTSVTEPLILIWVSLTSIASLKLFL